MYRVGQMQAARPTAALFADSLEIQEELAPQVGLEPTTLRLTAGCSAIELLRSSGRKQVGNYSQTTPLVNLSFPANMGHSAKMSTGLNPNPGWRLDRNPYRYSEHD